MKKRLVLLLIFTSIFFQSSCTNKAYKGNQTQDINDDREVMLQLGSEYVISAIDKFYNDTLREKLSDFDIEFSGVVSKYNEKYIDFNEIPKRNDNFRIDEKLAYEIGSAAIKSKFCLDFLTSDCFEITYHEHSNTYIIVCSTVGVLKPDFWVAVNASDGRVLHMVGTVEDFGGK